MDGEHFGGGAGGGFVRQGRRYLAWVHDAAAATARESLLREGCQFPESNLGRRGVGGVRGERGTKVMFFMVQ